VSAMASTIHGETRLLLVEDEPTQQMALQRLLRGVGYAVDVAPGPTTSFASRRTRRS
jgi:CheY-like chemotaxis protein